jgi:serine/threonine protein kinase
MEYCGSRTVSKFIRHTFAEARMNHPALSKGESEARLDNSQAKPLIKQLLMGLKAIHEEGICHRDLKVTNLLINRHKALKIIDYGFSTYYKDWKLSEENRTVRKRLDMYCGTPSYMAPEMIVIRINKKLGANQKAREMSSETSSLIENF